MHIGFDAKRAFQNKTGLGNYSRMVIDLLSEEGLTLSLFTPTQESHTHWSPPQNSSVITPGFGSPVWRPWGMTRQIKNTSPDIYHGLSHELPFNIQSFKGPKVVSMHDCIFRHFPKSYTWIDQNIYNLKWKNALQKADKVIAISQSTADDLINFYQVDANKIEVIHLFTSAIYHEDYTKEEVGPTLKRHSVSRPYFLFVGNHHPRKNMDLLIRAYSKAPSDLPPVLIVGGDNRLLKNFVTKQGLEDQIIIPDSYLEKEELAHLYHQAIALIYPSLYEGFGLPVLEAMQSGCPVVTCYNSSLKEVGGDAVLYTDEEDEDELLMHLKELTKNTNILQEMRNQGIERAKAFSANKHKQQLLQLYEELIG